MTYNPKIVVAYYLECGLSSPELEYAFHPERKWRFDFAWPYKRVALEVQGGVWSRGKHGRGSGIVKDMEKANAAARLGWRVLYVVPDNVCMLETVDLIRDCLTERFPTYEWKYNEPPA